MSWGIYIRQQNRETENTPRVALSTLTITLFQPMTWCELMVIHSNSVSLELYLRFLLLLLSQQRKNKHIPMITVLPVVQITKGSDLHTPRDNSTDHADNSMALCSRNNYYDNSNNLFLGRHLSLSHRRL